MGIQADCSGAKQTDKNVIRIGTALLRPEFTECGFFRDPFQSIVDGLSDQLGDQKDKTDRKPTMNICP